MSIPCKMRPAGLDSLPMEYTRLWFLENTGTQYINTGLKATGTLKIGLDVMATAWGGPDNTNYIFGSAFNLNNIAFSMNYNNNNGTVGRYFYGKQFDVYFFARNYAHVLNKRYKYVFDENVVYRDGKLLPFMNNIVMKKETFTSTRPILLFGTIHHNGNQYLTTGKRVFSFSIFDNAAGVLRLDYVPALDPSGRPCMFDLVSKQPVYNKATSGSDFIAGMTLGQALKLKDLPAKTATLDISLPEGYESNAEIMESIRQAEEKGWTINRTTYTPS